MPCTKRSPSSPSARARPAASACRSGRAPRRCTLHPVARRLLGERLGEADHAGLGGRVDAEPAASPRGRPRRPRSRSRRAPRSCMPGSTAWVTAITPRRFTASTRSHMLLGRCGRRSRPRRCRRCSPARRSGRARPRRPPRPRSPSRSSARPAPARRRRSRRPARARRSRSRSATATRAPSAASRAQVAAPMPPAPPVTSAISSLEPHRPAQPYPVRLGSRARGTASPSRSSAAPARSASAWRCGWPRAGLPVVIGSRDAGRAEEAAGRVREQVPEAAGRGARERRGRARAGRSCSWPCRSAPSRRT